MLIKNLLCAALSLTFLTSTAHAEKPKLSRSAAPHRVYAPEKWEMNLQFRNFPFSIDCKEENNRGRIEKRGSGRNSSYKIAGFPETNRLTCLVDGSRRFIIDLDNLFGVGRKKRVMGGEYFAGEVRRVDLKVQYQSNSIGYGSYKAHAKRYTVFGTDRIIYSEQSMFEAFFPARANQPVKRWKP